MGWVVVWEDNESRERIRGQLRADLGEGLLLQHKELLTGLSTAVTPQTCISGQYCLSAERTVGEGSGLETWRPSRRRATGSKKDDEWLG